MASTRLTCPHAIETLQALADGLDHATIAWCSAVSEETVRAQVRLILRKLNVDSRLQAVLLALRHGVISLD